MNYQPSYPMNTPTTGSTSVTKHPNFVPILSFATAMLATSLFAAAQAVEGPISAFRGEAKFEIQPLFEAGRLPNVVVTGKGSVRSVLVVHGAYDGKKKEWWDKGVQVRRSEDAGKTWGAPITVANPGWNAGGATVDEISGEILVFVEQMIWPNPPTEQAMYRSRDDGKTWTKELPVIKPDAQGRAPSLHMAEHCIQLQRGSIARFNLSWLLEGGETGDGEVPDWIRKK